MENIEEYKKAGKIAADTLHYGKSLIKRGVSVLEICDKVEEHIFKLGGKPAFPAQISLNEIAAHFCPEDNDEIILDDQLVSLDVGVHINGCIGDNACTIDLSGKNNDLVKASREALDNAIAIIRTGITLGEVGRVIGGTISSYGFKPVMNLSGHGLDSYNIHCKPTVPNYDNEDNTKLEDGQVIAVEPFATNGAGLIHEKGDSSVFSLAGKKSVRMGFVREIMRQIESYNGLPFTTRWLVRKFSESQVNYSLNQFKLLGILREYPPLVEKQNGLVSQAEHTVLVGEKPVVLTKYD